MNSPQSAPRAASQRSRVTNGKELLPGLDQRSSLARRYRDLVDALLDTLPSDLTETDRLQVRNAATLQVHAETLTARMCNGESIDPESITRAVNGANRALAKVRRDADARRGIENGGGLKAYLATRATAAPVPSEAA